MARFYVAPIAAIVAVKLPYRLEVAKEHLDLGARQVVRLGRRHDLQRH